MKKLSLLNLSKHTLDKLQQNALRGGGLPSCICAFICNHCPCSTVDDSAESLNFGGSVNTAEWLADAMGDVSN